MVIPILGRWCTWQRTETLGKGPFYKLQVEIAVAKFDLMLVSSPLKLTECRVLSLTDTDCRPSPCFAPICKPLLLLLLLRRSRVIGDWGGYRRLIVDFALFGME
jgi:hypothetical protein